MKIPSSQWPALKKTFVSYTVWWVVSGGTQFLWVTVDSKHLEKFPFDPQWWLIWFTVFIVRLCVSISHCSKLCAVNWMSFYVETWWSFFFLFLFQWRTKFLVRFSEPAECIYYRHFALTWHDLDGLVLMAFFPPSLLARTLSHRNLFTFIFILVLFFRFQRVTMTARTSSGQWLFFRTRRRHQHSIRKRRVFSLLILQLSADWVQDVCTPIFVWTYSSFSSRIVLDVLDVCCPKGSNIELPGGSMVSRNKNGKNDSDGWCRDFWSGIFFPRHLMILLEWKNMMEWIGATGISLANR